MKVGQFVILAAVLASLAAVTAFAQSGPVNLTMKASGGSGVTGTATLTESGGQVTVVVNLQGLPPNTAHAGHIHSPGTCAQDVAGNSAPVQFPLSTITADASGKGSATGTVSTTLASLEDGKHYVNYHVSDNPPGKGISCADITAAPASLPATGGPNDSALPLLAFGCLAALAGAGLMLRRRVA